MSDITKILDVLSAVDWQLYRVSWSPQDNVPALHARVQQLIAELRGELALADEEARVGEDT